MNFEITEDNLFGKIIEFEKLEGEATANNRKGKLIFFYEWNLVLKWEGKVLNDDSKIKVEGKITIPNLSEENSIDEIDIQINVNETNEKSEIVKQFMYTVGRKKIREQINKYILCLQSDYAKNLILPKKDDVEVKFSLMNILNKLIKCNLTFRVPTKLLLSHKPQKPR